MGDKSESSCLESEDECEVENQRMDLGLLRDTPSLATDVEGCLSLAEENSATHNTKEVNFKNWFLHFFHFFTFSQFLSSYSQSY